MILDREPLSASSTPSSSGWSDLPEDASETFGMSLEEADDYHRNKRRRLLEEAHDHRMKEREAEDAEVAAAESLVNVEASLRSMVKIAPWLTLCSRHQKLSLSCDAQQLILLLLLMLRNLRCVSLRTMEGTKGSRS
jgi:hypothetical protein